MAQKVLMIGDTPAIAVTEEQLAQAGLSIGDDVDVIAMSEALIVTPKGSQRGEFFKGVVRSMEQSPGDYERLAK